MKPSTARKKLLRRIAIAFVGIAITVGISSWMVATELIRSRQCEIGPLPEGLLGDSISISSKSGSRLAGWSIPAPESKGVVILLHGIGGSRLSMLERARFLHSANYSVVMIDLRSHGESTGRQVTMGFLEAHDVRATIDFARSRYRGQSIGIVGVSLGGASTLLAAPLDVDAVVLESVYSTIDQAVDNRVAMHLGPLSDLPSELLLMQIGPRIGASRSQLRPIDQLPLLTCPVLILSGADDRHTTPSETSAMFEAANEPKEFWLVQGAAHEDLCRVDPKAYRTKLLDFLERHLPR